MLSRAYEGEHVPITQEGSTSNKVDVGLRGVSHVNENYREVRQALYAGVTPVSIAKYPAKRPGGGNDSSWPRLADLSLGSWAGRRVLCCRFAARGLTNQTPVS